MAGGGGGGGGEQCSHTAERVVQCVPCRCTLACCHLVTGVLSTGLAAPRLMCVYAATGHAARAVEYGHAGRRQRCAAGNAAHHAALPTMLQCFIHPHGGKCVRPEVGACLTRGGSRHQPRARCGPLHCAARAPVLVFGEPGLEKANVASLLHFSGPQRGKVGLARVVVWH